MTEFKCTGEEKLYLSPILDLCNGEVIAYGINKRPILDLVIKPLEEAVGILKEYATVRTILHSDQGWQYQHNRWIKTLRKNNVFRNMSRKATFVDNAAIENFFGILK